MSTREESLRRLSTIWGRTRVAAGISQERMAEEMGVARKTIQNWEKGASAPDIEQGFRWFNVLGLSPFTYIVDYAYPEMEERWTEEDSEKLRASLITLVETLPTEAVSQLMYLISGGHGSSPIAILQLMTAHLQTPMRDRVTQAGVILKNYEIAEKRGMLACPDSVKPDFEFLSKAISAGEAAVYGDMTGYVLKDE